MSLSLLSFFLLSSLSLPPLSIAYCYTPDDAPQSSKNTELDSQRVPLPIKEYGGKLRILLPNLMVARRYSLELKAENQTGKVLDIGGTIGSCACTIGKVEPIKLERGATTRIELTVTTPMTPGDFSQQIQVVSSSGDIVCIVQLDAKVVREVSLAGALLPFEKDGMFVLQILPESPAFKVIASKIRLGNDQFEIREVFENPDGTFKAVAAPTRELQKVSKWSGVCQVDVNGPDGVANVQLPFTVQSRDSVAISPRVLRFSKVPDGHVGRAAVLVKGSPDLVLVAEDEFHIQDKNAPTTQIPVRVKAVERARGLWKVDFDLTAELLATLTSDFFIELRSASGEPLDRITVIP